MNSAKLTSKTMLRLVPGIPVLARDANEIQIGLNPETSIRLPIEFRKVLAKCTGANSIEQICAYANDLDFDSASTKRVIENLVFQKVLVPEVSELGQISVNQKSQLLDAQRATKNDPETIAKRLSSRITLIGAGRVGTTLALLLGNSGFANLRILDQQRITRSDLTPWGPSRIDIGQRRDHIAQTLLGRLHPNQLESSYSKDARQKTSLVIYACDPKADFPFFSPQLVDRAMSNESPFMVIAASADQVFVSSILIPGESGCTRCFHLNQTDRDSAWPLLISQLIGRQIDDTTSTDLVLTAACFAFAQVANWIDVSMASANNWFRLTSGEQPKVFVNYPHSECGCTQINSQVA